MIHACSILIVRAVKLFRDLSALLPSADGRAGRRDLLIALERGEIHGLLLWLRAKALADVFDSVGVTP